MAGGAFVIAVVGAACTGKSALARGLSESLRADGDDAALIGDIVGEFCDTHRRTPRRDELRALADEQSRRIATAVRHHDTVVADTSALTTAVHSDIVFGDTLLYAAALRTQSSYGLSLLTALERPSMTEGLPREGAAAREPLDTRLRLALQRGGIAHAVVGGSGPARLRAALAALRGTPRIAPHGVPDRATAWHTLCGCCGDPGCERRLLARG